MSRYALGRINTYTGGEFYRGFSTAGDGGLTEKSNDEVSASSFSFIICNTVSSVIHSSDHK